MSYTLKCFKQNGSELDITELVKSIKWSGDYKSCSRKLEFSIISASNDVNIPNIDIPLSSLIVFLENDKELFRGFIYERSKSSSGNTTDFICFDYCEKLNKIKVCYSIKNKTAQDVLKMALKDYGFKISKDIAGDNTKTTEVFMNVSLYEMIMTCYKNQSKKNGKPYMLFANKDEIGSKVKGAYAMDMCFEEGYNIISTSFHESINNMVNQVVVVDEKGNKKSSVKDEGLLKIHGLFQEIYQIEKDKDATAEAKAMLKGVEQSCTLEGFGDTSCIVGYNVKVKDTATGLVGSFYINSDVHTWVGNKHTISLNLSFDNLID